MHRKWKANQGQTCKQSDGPEAYLEGTVEQLCNTQRCLFKKLWGFRKVPEPTHKAHSKGEFRISLRGSPRQIATIYGCVRKGVSYLVEFSVNMPDQPCNLTVG